MPLTEEERKKIYEEEKARIESQSKIKKGRKLKGCFTVIIVVFLFLLFIVIVSKISEKNQSTSEAPSPPQIAKIHLKIKDVKYEYGYFKVNGIAENIGNKEAFSPTITLRVYDDNGKTLLAEDVGWPAGHYLKNFTPGSSAAFQLSTSIPGEPPQVRWEVIVKDFLYEIDSKKK
jgi:hypothetical protein